MRIEDGERIGEEKGEESGINERRKKTNQRERK